MTKSGRETRPLFLYGSLQCAAFPALQNFTTAKRDPAVVKTERDAGRDHLIFSMNISEIQTKGG